MSSKIIMICRSEIATGYRLAGVLVYSVVDAREAESIILREMNRSNVGLIAVEDIFYLEFETEFIKKIEAREKPVVFPIPSKSGVDTIRETLDYVESMIERSSGMFIKIK